MLNLDHKLSLNKDLADAPNLCDRFDRADLDRLGNMVWESYDRDKRSRSKWERRTDAAMNLALQIAEAKNFPWPNCANIKFPLVTIAAMQYHAIAYPVLVDPPDVVQYRVIGADATGDIAQRARRVGEHMSYQRIEEDRAWTQLHDRLILNNSIVGTTFKKSYYNSELGYPVSETVLAKDLVLDYYAKSVDSCLCKTHIIPLTRNEIYERCQTGTFRDVRKEAWFQAPAQVPAPNTQDVKQDNRQGVNKPIASDDLTPFTCLEQHRWIDLDKDGYLEPYIVTIEHSSKCVLRIVARFEWDDVEFDKAAVLRIKSTEYFTKYGFIPSPDGGIYDIGFGVLLGPLNESTNSIINQLVDAGTMSLTAGGFLGRGAKIRGGVYQFAPFTWTRVDSTGDDLQKSMFPLPVREPNVVMFQLLSLIINYTNRISGSGDVMVGENPGQNTPAETHRRMAEMGQKIYSSIFKRHWECMREEFRKLYILNAHFLPQKKNFGSKKGWIMREDYLGDPSDIAPVADPNITSDHMKVVQATALKQTAMSTQGYDLEAVERRYLKALKVPGIDEVYKGPGKVPPLPNPKVMVEQMRQQPKMLALQLDKQQFVMEMMENRRLNNAKIIELEAKAALEMEEAGGVKEGHRIAAFAAAIGAMRAHDEHLKSRIDQMLKQMELENDASTDGGGLGKPPAIPSLPSLPGAASAAAGVV
jgi:chaperonin GroES